MSEQITLRLHVIQKDSGFSVKNVRIEIWDKHPTEEDELITETITDTQGFARLKIAAVDLQENNTQPDIYFKLFYEDELLRSTEENILWNLDEGDQIFQIAVDAPSELLVDNQNQSDPISNENYLPHQLVAGHPDQFIEGRYFQPVIVYSRITSGRDDDDQDDINGREPTNGDHDNSREDDNTYIDLQDVLARREEDQIEEPIFSHKYRTIAERQYQAARSRSGDDNSDEPEWNFRSPGIKLLRQNLGILFYDRMRYRFTGSVLGEQLYTVSLAPGEEVTLTQNSETRRAVSMEEVQTREEEQELTLSSTWSTEVTSDQAQSASTSVGGDLGISGGIAPPKVDFLKIGANSSAHFDRSLETSSSEQQGNAYEISRELSRRARQEHATTFKIESEETTTFGSKRLLLNRNPTRSLSFNFFKIYNKYRVILERYNAKLALSLTLSNPFERMFSQIENAIEVVAYDNPKNYDCKAPPESEVKKKELPFEFDDPIEGLGHWLPGTPTMVDVPVPDAFIEKPNNNLELDYAEYSISSWQIKEVELEDPDDWTNWNTKQTTKNKSAEEFSEYKGEISLRASEQGDPEGTGVAGVGIYLDVNPDFHPLVLTHAPGVWWTTKVEITVKVHFKPIEGIDQKYDDCLTIEEERLYKALTPELVTAVIQNVTGQTTEHLYMRLIETYFLSLFAYTGSQVDDFLIRDFRNYFDWNEAIIQELPSWMQGKIAARFERLLERIQELIPGFDARSVFPEGFDMSGVEVFLPLRPGMERNVFEFLNAGEGWNGDAYISTFESFHKKHFGSVASSLPTYKNVLAPEPDRATTLGATIWQGDWEKPRRRFEVLDEWADYMPTDGVFIESMLGQTDSSEALQAEALRSDLDTAVAHQELLHAQAEAARKLADREDITVHYNISDEG